MAHIFLTGATGFLGRHLVPLLQARGHQLSALARAGGSIPGVTSVPGDLRLPGLGLRADPAAFDLVVHLAARYDLSAPASELHDLNVQGTQRLLDWLGPNWGGVLHHVSSVAVAGDFAGTFEEGDFARGQGFPNPYHRSKYEAEALVRASSLRFVVHRPSAIVGHSRTGEANRADGAYHLFPALKRARDLYPSWLPLPNLLEGRLDMVPVDWVAAALAHFIEHAAPGRTVHLVDPRPPYAGDTWNLLANAAGAPTLRGSLTRWKKRVPFVFDAASGLGSVSWYSAQRRAEMGVPREIQAAFNPHVRYGAESADELAAAGLTCPPQSSYAAPLWDYWLRHLDPVLRPEDQQRGLLAGKVVLITGASSGIGAELALACGRAGATVLLAARREEELQSVVATIGAAGGIAASLAVDLNELDACDALIAWALQGWGRVDVLINNAARSIRRPAAESLERFHDFERVMRLNYFAPLRLIRGVLPGMRERRNGIVVNVLTAGVTLPTPYFGAYASSKAALGHITDTLAAEHLHEGVHFMSALLPWVRTAMMDADRYGETQAMSAEDAAAWILEGMVARRRRVVGGAYLRRWALNVLAPTFMTRMLSLITRIYPSDPALHPEFEADRALLKRFFGGPLV